MKLTLVMDDICNNFLDEMTRKMLISEQLYLFAKPGQNPETHEEHNPRPVTPCSVFLKIAEKIIHQAHQDQIVELIHPIQRAFGIRSGIEKLIHGIQSVIDDDKSESMVLYSSDFENAFGRADVEKAITILRGYESLQTMFRFISLKFGTIGGTPVHLLMDHNSKSFLSKLRSGGIPQESSLGSILFCVSLIPMFEHIERSVSRFKEHHPEKRSAPGMITAIIDDVQFLADADVAEVMVRALYEYSDRKDSPIKINVAKTKVLPIASERALPALVEKIRQWRHQVPIERHMVKIGGGP
jgi:hypothetical protein